jgi:hypothetical protein
VPVEDQEQLGNKLFRPIDSNPSKYGTEFVVVPAILT